MDFPLLAVLLMGKELPYGIVNAQGRVAPLEPGYAKFELAPYKKKFKSFSFNKKLKENEWINYNIILNFY